MEVAVASETCTQNPCSWDCTLHAPYIKAMPLPTEHHLNISDTVPIWEIECRKLFLIRLQEWEVSKVLLLKNLK